MTHTTRQTPEYIIWHGDDAQNMADLRHAVAVAERQAEQARRDAEAGSSAQRYGHDDPAIVVTLESKVARAKAEFDAAVDDALVRATVVRYQHIGSKRFRQVLSDHAARQVDGEPDESGATKKVDHPDDAGWGLNVETFPMALLDYEDPDDPTIRTIVEPEFPTRAERRRFLEVELSEGQFDELWQRVYLLNRGGSADPKQLKFYDTTDGSSET